MTTDYQSNAMSEQSQMVSTEVVAAGKRREFTAEQKQRILRELDRCKHGEAGAIYRREGIYASNVTAWRKEQTAALAPQKRGPKPVADTALRLENQRLQRRVAELEKTLRQAETIMEVQKKLSEILGITLPDNSYRPIGDLIASGV